LIPVGIAFVTLWPLLSFAYTSYVGGGTWRTAWASLYYAVATVISIYLQARTWKEFANCAPALDNFLHTDTNRDTFRDLLAVRFSEWRGLPYIAVAVLLSVAVSVLVESRYRDRLLSALDAEFTLVSYVQLAVVAWTLAVAGLWLLRIPRLVTRVLKLDNVNLNLLEPMEDPAIESLSVLFSKASLRAAAGLLINGLPIFFLARGIDVSWLTILVAGGLTLGVMIVVTVFVRPQFAMHELAVKRILQAKADISKLLANAEPMTSVIALYQYQIVANARRWAVDAGVLGRYLLAALGAAVPIGLRFVALQ
jgi:hypothetical protein